MRIQIDQHAVQSRHETIIQHHVARPHAQPVLRHEPLQRRQVALGKIGHQQHHHILAFWRHRKIHVGFIWMDFLLGNVMGFGDHVQAVQRAQRDFARLSAARAPAHLIDMAVQGDGDGERQETGFLLLRLRPIFGTKCIATEANAERLPNIGHLNTERQCIGTTCIEAPQLQTRLIVAQQPVEVIFELQNQTQLRDRQLALLIGKIKAHLANLIECFRREQRFDARNGIDAVCGVFLRKIS